MSNAKHIFAVTIRNGYKGGCEIVAGAEAQAIAASLGWTVEEGGVEGHPVDADRAARLSATLERTIETGAPIRIFDDLNVGSLTVEWEIAD